jgi:hypothetical protein
MYQSVATKLMNVVELTGMALFCDFGNAAQLSKVVCHTQHQVIILQLLTCNSAYQRSA